MRKPSPAAQRPEKALLVTTTTTVVAPQHTTAVLMLRSPLLATLALPAARWPAGALVHTADELHLTLCYLGEAADLEPRRAAVAAVVQAMAAELPPVAGTISGMGRFSGEDGVDAVYCSFDSPDLARWLVRLQEGLAGAGFPVEDRHGHDPHITLAYVPAGEAVDLPAPWPIEVWFDTVTLGWGTAYTDYALGGAPWEAVPDVVDAAQAGAAAAGEPADGAGVAEPAVDATPAETGDALNAQGHPLAVGDTTPPAAEGDALKSAPALWLKDRQPGALVQQNDPASRAPKALPHFTKDIDGRTVVGVFSVFGNVDSYLDVCMPGSFAKTFRERRGKIHHLWQHDTSQPAIAVIDGLQEVGRDALPQEVLAAFPEATGGAEVRRTYLERSPLAEWVFEGIQKGGPYEMSYMYDPIRFEFVEQGGQRLRLIHEQRLWETSDVLWGANPATRASKADGAIWTMPLDLLLGQIEHQLTRAQKAGARHSADDVRALNAIHKLAVQLGCTSCKGMTDEEEEDAKAAPRRPDTGTHAPSVPSLAMLKSNLDYLIFLNEGA